jgi:hypothetical protein
MYIFLFTENYDEYPFLRGKNRYLAVEMSESGALKLHQYDFFCIITMKQSGLWVLISTYQYSLADHFIF